MIIFRRVSIRPEYHNFTTSEIMEFLAVYNALNLAYNPNQRFSSVFRHVSTFARYSCLECILLSFGCSSRWIRTAYCTLLGYFTALFCLLRLVEVITLYPSGYTSIVLGQWKRHPDDGWLLKNTLLTRRSYVKVILTIVTFLHAYIPIDIDQYLVAKSNLPSALSSL